MTLQAIKLTAQDPHNMMGSLALTAAGVGTLPVDR